MTRPDFNRIVLLIKELITASKTTVEAIGEIARATTQAAEQEPPQPLSRITVDLQIPSEETNRYYSEQNKSQRLHWATFWATLATFLAVAVYAVVTFLQGRTMDATFREVRKQTAAATKSATASEMASQ